MNRKVKKTGNLYVILIALLMAVAVIAAVAGAMNRSRQLAEELETTGETTDSESGTEDVFFETKDEETENECETEGDETEKTNAEPEELPTFMNPTGGALMNSFSIDIPVFSTTMEDYRTHSGVDIYVSLVERILAAADGTIDEIWEDPMMGTCMSITHAGGAETIYMNLSPELPDGIEAGKKVTSGTFIAVGGESALTEIAEEPHLHFEMTVNGEYVDPCDYINFENAAEVYED